MVIKQLLQELAQEFLPGQSSRMDLELRKKMRKLYHVDKEEFDRQLNRINLIRKAENLEPLEGNEILSKSIKQDINRALYRKYKDQYGKQKEDAKIKRRNSKIIKLSSNYLRLDKMRLPKSKIFKMESFHKEHPVIINNTWELSQHISNLDNFTKKIKEHNIEEVYKNYKFEIGEKTFLVKFTSKPVYLFHKKSNKINLNIITAPENIKYRTVDTNNNNYEIRFPELNKKVVFLFYPGSESNYTISRYKVKIKKL